MGFAFYYRSTGPVSPDTAAAVERAAGEMCRGRSWLMCEPVHFVPGGSDGHLLGASKPNFDPHPADAAAAAGRPDGTTRDALNILCRLSREFGVDWEVGHDHSGGPVGHIRSGVCDAQVASHLEAFAHLGDLLASEFGATLDDDLT